MLKLAPLSKSGVLRLCSMAKNEPEIQMIFAIKTKNIAARQKKTGNENLKMR